MNNNDNVFDDVFDSLFGQTNSRTSTLKKNASNTTVSKNNIKKTTTKTKTQENLPFVKENSNTYSSRKEELINSINNIEYNNYDTNKLDGFNAAINAYKNYVDDNQNDFKKIDAQIDIDLKKCEQDLNQNPNDYYLAGYFDGLYLLNTIIYGSKLSRFKQLANKFE